MWSIDYVAQTAEEQIESIEGESVESTSGPIAKDKENSKLSVQDGEDIKSENEVKPENGTKTEEIEPRDREAAIKRVEELVKQMSLSQENEGIVFT